MKKEQFFDRPDSCYFMDEPKKIAAFCRKHWKEDVEALLVSADRICEHNFLFDLKWDVERTFVPVQFGEHVDWYTNPNGDQEFVWAFNRHRFFITLGQAYQFTGDEKYANAYTELAADWIRAVPHTKEAESGPWRSLEAGFRGEYWMKALFYFRESPAVTEQFLDLIMESMTEHAEYIISCHSPYRCMSNWGVIENHGLFDIALMLPQSRQTRRYAQTALENLTTQARMQIMRDGMHWEQTQAYHNEVFHCFMDVVVLCQRNHIPLPEDIRTRLYGMAVANRKLAKPDYRIQMMGDGDDIDAGSRMSEAAYLFSDETLRPEGIDHFDYMTMWDLGIAANEQYQKMQPKEPEYTSCLLADSGHAILRSDWSREANLLHLMCGTLGAGHSHGDKLHLDLVIRGEDVLMDAGRFTYVSCDDRRQFKDPSYHNTITVDGIPFYEYKDSWECSRLAGAIKPRYEKAGAYEYIAAANMGYMDIPGAVLISRKIIALAQKVYILVDEMYTGDGHEYQQYFHFNDRGRVQAVCDNRYVYRGEKTDVRFDFLSQDIQIEQGRSRISRCYNSYEENDQLLVRKAGDGFVSLITVISEEADDISSELLPVRSALKKTDYTSKQAEAIRVKGHSEEYIIVVCHEEVNSPTDLVEADGCLGYGNVIVFDKKKETVVGTVLDY